MKKTMTNITAKALRRAADLKDQIESLSNELTRILSGGGNGVPSPFSARRGRPPGNGKKPTGKRNMSPAARAKIAAAAKARWAKAKAAGKKSL